MNSSLSQITGDKEDASSGGKFVGFVSCLRNVKVFNKRPLSVHLRVSSRRHIGPFCVDHVHVHLIVHVRRFKACSSTMEIKVRGLRLHLFAVLLLKAASALEFQSQATVYDMTPRQPFSFSPAPAQVPELLASELLYVTPIDYSHSGHMSHMIQKPGAGDSSVSASGSGSGSADGGMDYDEFVKNVRTTMSDVRDTMMSVPTNIGNALLSMWAANAEQSRRAAAEAEKNKPKKPVIHWGKPVTVKKMNMKGLMKPHVMTRMKPAPASTAPIPIIVQVIMPTPAPTESDAEPSEQEQVQHHHRGRGRPRGRRPLRKRQTHRPAQGQQRRPGPPPPPQRPRRGGPGPDQRGGPLGSPPPRHRMQPRNDEVEKHELKATAAASMKFLVL